MKSHKSSSLVPAGDLGPLFMRIGVGVVFAWHGWLKFDGGVGNFAGFLGRSTCPRLRSWHG